MDLTGYNIQIIHVHYEYNLIDFYLFLCLYCITQSGVKYFKGCVCVDMSIVK